MNTNLTKIKKALISLSDKKEIKKLTNILTKYNIEVLSTGGTARVLSKERINVKEVSNYTNFPEILDGRVKTLHPKIHGGLLGKKNNKKHKASLKKYNIEPINLLVVNLYPFLETIENKSTYYQCIENIDIGGPAMIRSAAKNHENVTVITSTSDYSLLEENLKKNNGSTDLNFRKKLAAKAFSYTAYYDSIISQWFNNELNNEWPEKISISGNLSSILRYGENPHQKSALYKFPNIENYGIVNSEKIQGRPLSYNNLNDANAALELVTDFSTPTIAIIKHANPCGVATGKNNSIEIWKSALRTDPVSAFGGIAAYNNEIDDKLAKEMCKLFLELVIAPSFSKGALKIFSFKKNLRLLQTKKLNFNNKITKDLKQLSGGFLLQDQDDLSVDKKSLKVVTKRFPSTKERKDLLFAFKVAKHVKSNAIIYAKNGSTVGIGAGQMSRIDSTKIATFKAKEASTLAKLKKNIAYGSVVASDAFFPFDDGLIAAAEAGATAVIQPGGSLRDKEVIEAANKLDISMIFTGIRHFKH